MYAGQIAEEGNARDVFGDPAHPYTRELLRSTISLETEELHSIPGAPPNLIEPPPGAGSIRAARARWSCALTQDPVEQRIDGERRVLCWLHGPEERIPEGGDRAARARGDRGCRRGLRLRRTIARSSRSAG